MENCVSSLCTHQRPLNHLQTAILKLLGGPWLGLDGLGCHYVGPRGCSSTRIVTKSSPKPIPGATEGFPKKSNFGNLAGVTEQPTQRQFRGFLECHGSGYMGLAATMWVPVGAQVPALSLNHHPNPSQGRQKGFQKSRISEILQVSLNSLHNGNFGAFGGGHGSGYMGLAATTWVPMGAQVPALSLNHHPNPSQGRQKGFRKSPNFGNLAGVTKQPYPA